MIAGPREREGGRSETLVQQVHDRAGARAHLEGVVEEEPLREELEVLELRLPDVRFVVRCSSGTYVRAIARDLGDVLGVGAHLTELRRTGIGRFPVTDAVSPDSFADAEAVAGAAITPLEAVGHLGRVEVDDEVARRIAHGQRVRLGDGTRADETSVSHPGTLVAAAHGGSLVAIAAIEDGVLRPRKVFGP